MKKGKYERLRKQYPEQISLDQLYRICQISKRSALYLVKNNIIPSVDTGKQTWRYRIALDDVIIYLRRREQLGSMIPCGTVSSRHRNTNGTRKSFSQLVSSGEDTLFAEYLTYIYDEFPDVITVSDAAAMTGFRKETIHRYIRNGDLTVLGDSSKYYVPKSHLIKFAVSPMFFDNKSKSAEFKKLLGGFEIWKAAK